MLFGVLLFGSFTFLYVNTSPPCRGLTPSFIITEIVSSLSVSGGILVIIVASVLLVLNLIENGNFSLVEDFINSILSSRVLGSIG